MDYSSKESRVAFISGFGFALNVIKATGQNIDLVKLVATLKEIAERETTIALTPTDHLLAMENLMGKPLTNQQKEFYLTVILPQAQQDESNKVVAKLALDVFQGNLGTLVD